MRRLGGIGRWSLLVGFEPRDLWIGVYWDRQRPSGFIVDSLYVYLCVVPMLVVLFHRETTALSREGRSDG
jgi:hypothetical protein